MGRKPQGSSLATIQTGGDWKHSEVLFLVNGDLMQEVVDEEDEKLKNLREEWGEEVMNAVKTALEEVNEFNPSGRHVVPTLWNSEQGRVATLREVIAHMTHEIKTLKRKKNLKHRK
jgi:uncharacterized protein YnzC (UPF0291/DUF896 family)